MKNNEPRVRTSRELQTDFNKIDKAIEELIRKRNLINENINSKRKQLSRISELIDNKNQINMFPNDET